MAGFSSSHADLQFETAMPYADSSFPFIGDIVFSDDTRERILEKATEIFRDSETNPILTAKDKATSRLVFTATVLAAEKWEKDEDGLYDYLARTFNCEDNPQRLRNIITAAMDKLACRKEIVMLKCFQKKYYATIICHAFSPQKSIRSFFDLCWQIYANDMDYDFHAYDPLFSLITQKFSGIFYESKETLEDVRLGSNVYSIFAGIRGLAIVYPDLMEELLRRTVKTINELFKGQEINRTSRLNVLIRDWWQEKLQKIGTEGTQRKVSGEPPAFSYAEIRSRYFWDDNTNAVAVRVSAFRIVEYTQNPLLHVFCEGTEVESREIKTKGSGVIMTAKESEFCLSNLSFSHNQIALRVTITIGIETIYDSGRELFRPFLLFRREKEQRSLVCPPGNYRLFIIDFDSLIHYPEEISSTSKHIFSISAHEGECLSDEKKTFIFSSDQNKRTISFLYNEKRGASFRCQGEDFIVVDGDIRIVINNSPDISTRDILLRAGEEVFPLESFPQEQTEDSYYYVVSGICSSGIPSTVSVISLSDNKLLSSVSLVRFDSISINYDKPVYYGETSSCSVKICVNDSILPPKKFIPTSMDVVIRYGDGLFILTPPLLRWRIGNGEWNTCEDTRGEWYEMLPDGSLLELDYPSGYTPAIILNTDYSVSSYAGHSDRFLLGQSVLSLKGKEKQVRVFCQLGEELFPLTKYYLTPFLSTDAIIQTKDKTELIWSPLSFIGPEDPRFRITVYSSTREACKPLRVEIGANGYKTIGLDKRALERKKTEKRIISLRNLTDGYYQVSVEWLEKAAFGEAWKSLWNNPKQIQIGDERVFRYRGKTLKLSAVMLTGQTTRTPIRCIYVDNLSYLGDVDDFDVYSGNLFVEINGNKTYLNWMKNENGEKETVNPVRLQFRSTRSCWIVAGLNPDFTDKNDFETGELTFDRSTYQVGVRQDAPRVAGIDYYFFDVL